MAKALLILLMLALTWLWLPVEVFAHGQPEITVTPDTIAPGGKITVKGEAMGADEEFTLTLESLKFKAELGEVKANAEEEFTIEFTIPPDAPEGVYQVKAVGKDGDTVTAELTITGKPGTAATEPTEPRMPSAEEDKVPRRRMSNEIIGLFAAAVVSAGIGLTLVRWK